MRLYRWWRRLRSILWRVVLLPLLPVLEWGPATHPLITRQALERAETELGKGNPQVNPEIVELLSRHREAYVYGSNSADVISVYHIGSGGSAIYDYAHNFYPDHAGGTPVFGYALIDEWLRAYNRERDTVYPEREFAVACGWLSHQLADWYAHYVPVDGEGRLVPDQLTIPDGEYVFSGYANSHRILGVNFLPEILALYNKLDHALLELAHDIMVLANSRELRRNNRVELFCTYHENGVRHNLLCATSKRYRGVVAAIPLEHIDQLRNEFNLVIRGLKVAAETLLGLNPRLTRILRNSLDPGVTHKPDYISLAAGQIVDDLFCKSFAEISKLAGRLDCQPGPGAPDIRIREYGRSGTVIFQVLRRIGELIGDGGGRRCPQALLALKSCLVQQLVRCWGPDRVWRLAGRLHPDPALWGFVSRLFKGDSSDLEAPRADFLRFLQPVVAFDGPSGLNEAELLQEMIAGGELRVKVVPATALDRSPSPNKGIDPGSVRFWINNYPVEELPDFYRLNSAWYGPRLVLNCEIKGDLCPGAHLLHVNAADQGGVEGRALEREIHFARLRQSP
ncbi:MAG: zinc dependent phospholipase C family protein [Candidatus Desulforudis sp.]|nr:zinc dependent phospholipase C family protein [Desulforudis sp.]